MDADEHGDQLTSQSSEPVSVITVVPGGGWSRVVRTDVVSPLLLVTAMAIMVGLSWWQLGPVLRRSTDSAEIAVAGDAAFVAPAVLAGLLIAAWSVARPGSRPLVRLAVTLLGCLGGAVVARLIGESLGAPPLRATGVLLVWPTVVSLGVFVATLVMMISVATCISPVMPAV